MSSNFSLLLDELEIYAAENGWSFEGDEIRKAETPSQKSLDDAAEAQAQNDREVSDMVARSAALAKERKQKAADAKAEKIRIAAAKKKAAQDEIDARNNARANVSNVLAKALELNRLGRITAAEVARIEITANDVLARIG